MAVEVETISQVISTISYDGKLGVGCRPQIHQETMTLPAKLITLVPPSGLQEVGRLENGS